MFFSYFINVLRIIRVLLPQSSAAIVPLSADRAAIGVGGDRVSIADGVVLINGVPLDEQAYTYAAPGQNEPTVAKNGGDEWIVPAGQLFVLGDHHQRSTDSRNVSVGLVDVDWVVGRAWLRFFPLDTLGILQVPAYPELDQTG